MDEVINSFTTLKAIGNQWYWSYECGDYTEMEVEFNSYVIPTSELKTRDCRLREVGNRAILPVNFNVKALTTSNDVTHCWAVPSLGVKVDSLPGRLNQTAFIARRPGLFMGACSEIFVNFHIKIGEKNFYITPWQIWHQTSCNEIALELFKFHGYIMTIFVEMFMTVSYLMHTSLIGDLCVKNSTDHPTLETVWTIVPAIILVFIAFPSLRLHYVMDEVMNPFIALKP